MSSKCFLIEKCIHNYTLDINIIPSDFYHPISLHFTLFEISFFPPLIHNVLLRAKNNRFLKESIYHSRKTAPHRAIIRNFILLSNVWFKFDFWFLLHWKKSIVMASPRYIVVPSWLSGCGHHSYRGTHAKVHSCDADVTTIYRLAACSKAWYVCVQMR